MSVTLEELVLAVAANLHDYVAGTASADAGTSFKNRLTDTTRAVDGDQRHEYSQVLFLQPATGLTGNNPKTVSAFDAASGNFTLTDNWNATNGVPSGTPYAIIDIAGEGYAYADIVQAARQALVALKPVVSVEEAAVAITIATGNMAWTEVTVPATIEMLEEVHAVRASVDIGLVRPGNDGWVVVRGTRKLRLSRDLPLVATDTLTLYGTGPATFPATLDASVDIDLEEWTGATIEFLTRGGGDRSGVALAGNLYGDRARSVPLYRRPNSYRVG